MPLKPCLQTSVLAVEPTVSLGLRFRHTQLWSRVIPAHTGAHPGSNPSQELGGSHLGHPLGNRPTTWEPNCGPWSRSMSQCYPTEQGPGGHPIYQAPDRILAHPTPWYHAHQLLITLYIYISCNSLITGSDQTWLWFQRQPQEKFFACSNQSCVHAC